MSLITGLLMWATYFVRLSSTDAVTLFHSLLSNDVFSIAANCCLSHQQLQSTDYYQLLKQQADSACDHSVE